MNILKGMSKTVGHLTDNARGIFRPHNDTLHASSEVQSHSSESYRPTEKGQYQVFLSSRPKSLE